MKLKRKLDILKTTKEYNEMAKLRSEVDMEMKNLDDERKQRENIYAGLHIGN